MNWITTTAAAVVLTCAGAAGAAADQWNDRTTLTFSEPVMVPGATLAPGEYVFELADTRGQRHLVQIRDREGRIVATTQTIPTRRNDVSGDIVIRLNPTEAGAPVAIRSWFYPGSRYGHEFVYPDAQARQIAARTKTLVLSTDRPDSDRQSGTLYTYDAEGQRGARQQDAETMKAWDEWRQGRAQARQGADATAASGAASDTPRAQRQPGSESQSAASARSSAPSGQQAARQERPQARTTSEDGARATVGRGGEGTTDQPDSTSAAMIGESEGMKVSLDEIEENANRYSGRTIHVTAEVEEIFGPRLFKIDEPNWADLDPEVLVYMPTALAALVREGDLVTVTGEVKPFVRADIDREMSWLRREPGVEVTFRERPVLVATRIVGGNDQSVMAISLNEASKSGGPDRGASATSTPLHQQNRRGGGAPLTDVSAIAGGSTSLVGRPVSLTNVAVRQSTDAPHKGFWVESGGSRILVLPGENARTSPGDGQRVSIEGVVLQMPQGMRDASKAGGGAMNADIYVYATTVR